MIQTQKGTKTVVIEREFTEEQLIAKCTVGDVVSTRWFKAVA